MEILACLEQQMRRDGDGEGDSEVTLTSAERQPELVEQVGGMLGEVKVRAAEDLVGPTVAVICAHPLVAVE